MWSHRKLIILELCRQTIVWTLLETKVGCGPSWGYINWGMATPGISWSEECSLLGDTDWEVESPR